MPAHQTSSIFLNSLASLFSRFSGLATQIIMAWFLTPADYGLYAIALGITTFTTIMRGGGTGLFFQTLKLEEFPTIGGGLLRFAIGCGILGTIFTLAMVLPSSYLYPNDSTNGLGWILFWSAVGFLVFNVTTYPRAKVLSRLKFKQIAAMDTANALMKLAGAYFFAANGYGALSFVLSQLIGGIVVLAWSLAVAGMERTDFKVSPNWLSDTYTLMKIPFVIALITSLGGQADLFFFSFVIPVGALGVYLFTNQMAVQPVQMLSGTLQAVLAPYAARVRGNIDQEDRSARQTFFTGVIFVPIFVMGVAAVYPSLAQLLFLEKWDVSILPVQCACILLIYPTVQSLLEAPLMGARRWKLTLELFSGRMIGKLGGAALSIAVLFGARFVSPIPESIYPLILIIGVGLSTTVISFFQIKKVSKEIHVSNISFRDEMFLAPAYSILAAIGTSGLASSFVDLFGFSKNSIRAEALFEFIFCMITYGGVCAILLRVCYVEKLNNLLQLFPGTPRKLFYKALVLEEKPTSVL